MLNSRDHPTVSVVVSSFNYARFLAAALDSALNQTWPCTEVIVVDDGSTDASRDVIASFGDRVTPVLKANGGMASAQNAGFAASRGEIVVFLDADDILTPTAAETAVKLLEGGNESRIQWRMWEVDAEGRRSGRMVPTKALHEGDLCGRLVAEGPDACVGPPTSGNAWPREFLQAVMPIPEATFRRHSDTYLMTLAPLYGSLRAAATPQSCYRLHGANDYACRPVDEKNQRNLEMYEQRCCILARHLTRRRIAFDATRWKQTPGYVWMRRLQDAAEAIKAVVPPGASFILVDDQQLSDPSGQADVISGRRAIPFLERDGRYWGPPSGDAAAIGELDRLQAAGASFLVIAWVAFWWLDHFREFAEHVRGRYPAVVRNDLVAVYSLQ